MYFLRAKQIGLTLEEMEEITMGIVMDLIVESGNDDYKYREVATQEDFNKF